MAYLLAIWTGLRSSERRQLEWQDVRLNGEVSFIQLRAEITKARPADMLPLHVQLVVELTEYRPAAATPGDRVLADVPDMDVMKLDLTHAGIDYGNKGIGFADLHSMRMTSNDLLAANKVGSRVRQAQLRHADRKLTEVTYFDKSLYLQPHAEQLNLVAAIPLLVGSASAARPSDPARNMHEDVVQAGQFGAPTGTSGTLGGDQPLVSNSDPYPSAQADSGTNGHGPASNDAGP